MVSFKQLVLGSVAMIGFAASANAAFVTWDDNITQHQYVGDNKSYSYTHDITDSGFNPSQDFVTGFWLGIDLWDDQDRASEKFKVEINDLYAGSSYNFGADAFESSSSLLGTIFGLIELNAYGTLSVTIKSLTGDFYVGNSSLVANGISKQVPEPGTMALLGLGLLGAGFARRKKLN